MNAKKIFEHANYLDLYKLKLISKSRDKNVNSLNNSTYNNQKNMDKSASIFVNKKSGHFQINQSRSNEIPKDLTKEMFSLESNQKKKRSSINGIMASNTYLINSTCFDLKKQKMVLSIPASSCLNNTLVNKQVNRTNLENNLFDLKMKKSNIKPMTQVDPCNLNNKIRNNSSKIVESLKNPLNSQYIKLIKDIHHNNCKKRYMEGNKGEEKENGRGGERQRNQSSKINFDQFLKSKMECSKNHVFEESFESSQSIKMIQKKVDSFYQQNFNF